LNREKLDRKFLYAYLRSPAFRDQLATRAGETDMAPYVSLTSQRELSVLLPPIEEQRAIGHILGTLDDKIELNRRMNETLETIARAVFKSWFVDFDPVRAKTGGEPTEPICRRLGLTPDLLDLFPDSFQDSELGEIPEGWEIRKVETLLSRLSSKLRYTKDDVKPYGAVPVFEQGTGVLLGYHDGTAQFGASPEDPVFIFGDHTCVIHLACEPFDISQNVIPLKGSDRPTLWVFYAVRDKQVFQEYRRHWMELIAKEVVVAPEPICKVFAQLMIPLHLGNESSIRQSRELAAVRDTLLPKLLSGELRVQDTGVT
jgi:type I restriction enzyme, S subunit